jgi:hypothetical protein
MKTIFFVTNHLQSERKLLLLSGLWRRADSKMLGLGETLPYILCCSAHKKDTSPGLQKKKLK